MDDVINDSEVQEELVKNVINETIIWFGTEPPKNVNAIITNDYDDDDNDDDYDDDAIDDDDDDDDDDNDNDDDDGDDDDEAQKPP